MTTGTTINAEVTAQGIDNDLLTIDDVAKRLKVSTTTIFNWLNEKSPYHLLGFPKTYCLGPKRTRFRKSEIDAWLSALRPTTERPHHQRKAA